MIIGTRGSALAKAQTEMVIEQLKSRFPELEVKIKIIATTGDKVRDRPLEALGGFGAFVKELDQRIVSKEIDVAVNSLKDMPVVLTEGTALAAVLPRGPVEDVIVPDIPLSKLPEGATVGTSSVRRKALIRSRRPDLVIKDMRGNVPTRIRKWKEGMYDAIVLARAGIDRLGLKVPYFSLDPEVFVPAVGQGAIAIVCKENSPYLAMLEILNDRKTRTEVDAERFVLKALGGGCSVPIGVWARLEDDTLRLRGVVVGDQGKLTADIREEIPIKILDKGLEKVVEEMSKGMEGRKNACT